MMSYTRYPEHDFTLVISNGNTSIGEWIDMVDQYGSEGMTSLELYDLRRHTNLYSNEEIERILHKTIADRNLRPAEAKTAVLVNEVTQFGLARMYELKSEIEGIETPLQVCFDLAEAIEWLGGDVKQVLKDYV